MGVNLTSANYVFLLEPLLNTALDKQAIGRAWRMGQQRQVIVKRLFIQGSVEVRPFSCMTMSTFAHDLWSPHAECLLAPFASGMTERF